jgi:hypothetical protein
MTNTNYLPLHLSKLVHAKVPTLDVDTGWVWNGDGTLPIPPRLSHEIGHETTEGWVEYDHIERAYCLHDLVRALEELGKQEGWHEMRSAQHRLLEAYLDDNLADGLRLDGPKVEEFISKTFA